jgi:hypothetical protein
MANEVRLVDANLLRQTIESNLYWGVGLLEAIDNAPTIDPESLRLVGRKARSAISKTGLMCTNCYSDVDLDAVFCKYCGSKMEG